MHAQAHTLLFSLGNSNNLSFKKTHICFQKTEILEMFTETRRLLG